MTKISKRLEQLALFVEKGDSLVDVGCDHGLLSIYLVENRLCQSVIASDVNRNALQNAIDNISKRNLEIPTYLSDGIDAVPMNGVNTIVISGMGTGTILHILKDKNKIKDVSKLILQSNNDYSILRKSICDLGFYLEKESTIFDKGKWYVTCLFIRSSKKNSKEELEYGYLTNSHYIQYLINKYQEILKQIPESHEDALPIKEKISMLESKQK